MPGACDDQATVGPADSLGLLEETVRVRYEVDQTRKNNDIKAVLREGQLPRVRLHPGNLKPLRCSIDLQLSKVCLRQFDGRHTGTLLS